MVMPISIGGIWLDPLLIGAPFIYIYIDFPRINNIRFWILPLLFSRALVERRARTVWIYPTIVSYSYEIFAILLKIF